MSFPWLDVTRPRANADRHAQVASATLASRAGVLYRLGDAPAAAPDRRTAAIVAATCARWPG